ncbi:type VI secretion system baseplate subunit TssK [Niveispirillum sp. SYP-B3756]|uniref:type VI secretion system baseplate subunit TssK n=1 Tax=Niveispirillum sp. SYP-B3756 TaxID=2662178 RepID=UPI001291554C|nr:type VI secretion system baseplate subunit TssK [Niveispirillum sp. SYP-B3756]MQP64850.1 type VI secretion system baseplate subunit TssK [Niveispirillum sp. SYP-B3756]
MSADDLRGLYWTQGLFLTPQHFQLLEARPEALIQAHWRLLGGRDGWGVARWALRQGGLENGDIAVTALEAIMPDGSLIRAGTADRPNAILPSRARVAVPADHRGAIGLYAALPVEGDGLGQPSPDGTQGARRRQRPEAGNQRNRFDANDTVPVTHLTYQLELVLDVEPAFQILQSGHSLLRLATLYALDGKLQLSQEHVPPSLNLAADPLMGELLLDVTALLHHRALSFAELKRDRGIRAGNGTPQDVLRTLILTMLNRQVAQLRALLARADATHPADAHHLLSIIVAELSSFTEEYDLEGALETETPHRGLPAYDHHDIMGGLRQAMGLIRTMAKRLTAGPEAAITLEFNGNCYEADIPPHFFQGHQNRYYLRIECDLEEAVLANLMRTRAKLSARGLPEMLHHVATRGLKPTHLPRPPEDLPQRSARFVFFQIDPQENEWRYVEAEGAISLFMPELNPQSSRVQLLKAETT